MGRTFLRQIINIGSSDTFDDTLTAGSVMETTGSNLEQDLNNLRSQVKRVIWDDGSGNWYDDIPTINSKKRAINDLNFDLDDIETKPLLFRTQVLTDVFVSASSNVATLSGNEKPSEVFASGSTTTSGAVAVWLNSGSAYGSNSLIEASGFNAIAPRNLIIIRSGSSGDPILSNFKEIKGLLQVMSGTIDGTSFNDTTQRVQISFVRENATSDDLEAVPAVDIENMTINYSYVRRINFDSIPEQAFLDGRFVDQVGSVDVNLNNAIDNQMGLATQTQNIDWDIADTYELAFTADTGGTDLLKLSPTGGGNTIQLNIDTLDINNANTADFLNGITADSGGTAISIGAVAGEISSTAGLTIFSGGSSDARFLGAGELFFDDGNQTSSTWAQTNGIKLSETTIDWNNFKTEFGEISILEAIVSGSNAGGHRKAIGVLTTNVLQDTNVRGGVNLDASLLNYSGSNFLEDVNIFVNGVLMRNGADLSSNNDVYPGTDPSQGDLKFEFDLKGIGSHPDVITMEIFK